MNKEEYQPELFDGQEHVELSEQPEQLRLSRRRFGRLGAVAVTTLVSAVAAWSAYDYLAGDSGEQTSWDPTVEVAPKVDGKNVVLSWNMHNETSDLYDEIEANIEKYQPDVFALQEVSKNDAAGLHRRFPSWHIEFDMADSKTKRSEGGFGNVLMSPQPIEDIEDVVIEGNSVPDEIKRTGQGILRLSPKDISDATQEDRVAFGGTIKVATSEGLADVRVITLHISSDREIHQRQFDKLKKFILEQSQKGALVLAAGDFNSSFDQVAQNYTAEGFMVPRTTTTTKGPNPKAIDFYLQQADISGPLNAPHVEVLPAEGSDHNIVKAVAMAK